MSRSTQSLTIRQGTQPQTRGVVNELACARYDCQTGNQSFQHWLRYRRVASFLIAIVLTATPYAAHCDEPDATFTAASQIFEQRCVACHNRNDRVGKLSLATRQDMLDGAGGSPVIFPGDPASSLLLDVVTAQSGSDGEPVPAAMPPKGENLSAAEVEAIQLWIAAGMPWPAGKTLTADSAKRDDWWSWQPVVVSPPRVPDRDCNNPIDAYIADVLREANLPHAGDADRRTLIRRLYFDVLGLPPAPHEIAEFLGDISPDAWERIVDRVLSSPHLGERWARHWFDVVHYGESHGYDKDQPRPNAWPYRDYVIRSFNDDKPYSRFVTEQLAGDSIAQTPASEGIPAMGFLSAGPWDLIGHAEVPESKLDGKIARHLDRDDMVANTMGTFTSTTVHCAQCHNHKFDSISQRDYYSLQAVFAAVDRADRLYDSDSRIALTRAELRTQADTAAKAVSDLTSRIAALGGEQLARIDGELSTLDRSEVSVPEAHGYHSQLSENAAAEKWVQIDLGQGMPIHCVVLRPCYDDFANIRAGFGFPLRYRVEASDDVTWANVTVLADRTATRQPNPALGPVEIAVNRHTARYIRLTATELAPRDGVYILALAELQVLGPDGSNLARQATVTALDSIEALPRWSRENLCDDKFPTGPDESRRLQLQTERAVLIERTVPAALRSDLMQAQSTVAEIESRRRTLPPQQPAYAAGVYTGSGPFTGTGSQQGRPREIALLARGDLKQPREIVSPGAIAAMKTVPYELPDESAASESQRRVALAKWLIDPQHPLTWRSAANRIWQHHFGRGLVETANDFGRMGSPPSHPRLLDWLATELRDHAGSWKHVHRVILSSATYRRRSMPDDAEGEIWRQCDAFDQDNRLLWRGARRKLDAESVRDAVLAVTRQLNDRMHGPSFQDFVIEHPEHSPHYEYGKFDPRDPRAHRRAVYRFIIRSQQQPFMVALDCADPSIQVDHRTEALSPLQALATMNNGLILSVAELAGAEQPAASDYEFVMSLFTRSMGREPLDLEITPLISYTREHGRAAVCRLIFNLNEFVYID